MISSLTERGSENHPARAGTGRGGLHRQAPAGHRRRHAGLCRGNPRQAQDRRPRPPAPPCGGRASAAGNAAAQHRRSSPSAPPPAAPRRSKCCSACRRTVPGGHHPAHASSFTRSFAERLDRLTRLSVSEARDGDRILPGHALVAPGDHHMEVQRSGANYVVRLNRQAQVNGHRPAVDVMFESLARCAGRNLLAGLLTGMGRTARAGSWRSARPAATPWPRTRLPAWSTACPRSGGTGAAETCCRSNGSPPRCSSKPPGAAAATASERDTGRPAALFAAPQPPRRDPADDRPEPRAFACSPSLWRQINGEIKPNYVA